MSIGIERLDKKSWCAPKRIKMASSAGMAEDVKTTTKGGVKMFLNAEAAMRWAFTMTTVDIVKMSGANKMYGKLKPATSNELLSGLTPQEMHQQASSIVSLAHELSDPVCTEYLVARYGREFDEQHIGRLIERVLMMLGTGAHNRRAIRKLVLCYFDVRIARDEIRGEMGCRNDALTKIRAKVYDALDQVNNRAMSEIENLLKDRCLVA
jgi:hypothetical protein